MLLVLEYMYLVYDCEISPFHDSAVCGSGAAFVRLSC